MKTLEDLEKKLQKWQQDIDNNIMKAQQETAQKIWEDVVEIAPFKTGDYIASISVEPTIKENNEIKTFVGSDLCVEAKSTNKTYNLGYLLEHGTLNHAIPNAFNWGVIFGYNSEQYARTLDPNWHPGTIAQPHYSIAMEKNKKLYTDNISGELNLSWREK